MSEYIIDIDVDKARFSEDGTKIQLVPSVLREIVHCRDCKHFSYGGPTSAHKDDWCAFHDHIGWSTNGFCAWGERRAE